ncbi:hypothetical protein ACFLQN_02645 [Candidatus Aenigmatarchaeota archaeon]
MERPIISSQFTRLIEIDMTAVNCGNQYSRLLYDPTRKQAICSVDGNDFCIFKFRGERITTPGREVYVPKRTVRELFGAAYAGNIESVRRSMEAIPKY